jgi:hypothetical protein
VPVLAVATAVEDDVPVRDIDVPEPTRRDGVACGLAVA